jgi:error-prone DNA polymerase
MPFSELLGRSAFSFLRGASHPEELVDTAHSLGLASLGLCDRDGLYGCVRAWNQARQCGLDFHVGCELSLAHPTHPVVRAAAEGPPRNSAPLSLDHSLDPPTVSLLVRDQQGYENLCQLLTLAHAGLRKGVALLELDMLREHHAGLTAILPVQLDQSPSHLLPWLDVLQSLFGDRGAVAVYRRWDTRDRDRENLATEWGKALGFPLIASNYPLFHAAERKPLADIIHCIRNGTTLDRAGRDLSANAEATLRPEAQMLRLFRGHADWVQHTASLAQELQFDLSQIHYQFPCLLEPGQTADDRLAHLTWQGARRRYPAGVPMKVRSQLEKELKLIERLKVAAYFLCTWEIVEIARGFRILCQGRGSAANSAVCYVLGITAVDPARSNLLFERFLSEERNEPPDIDIDFEHERREEVIQEIYRRYGREHAAMVSEIICYRGKSALREVGKTLGLSLEQVDRLSQSITHWDTAEMSEERLREYGFDPKDRRLQYAVHWARELHGFPRHLSIHVGGFVLSRTPLHHVAPVEPAAMPGRTVIPWDKDDIETLGFFKVDVLGLGMLTAIRKALELIFNDGNLRTNPDESFDALDVAPRVPAKDPAVYAMISEADTVGVFQIESRAQMTMLPRLRPQCFYDLVIEVAIVRPGPIQGGMVHPYLRRRNDEEPVDVPHPDLWPILERTLGVPLFQEQVMQISIVGAGYTGGQADQLRRDMAAWKKTGRLLRHRAQLLEGFAKKGISTKFGEALFEQIKGFGDYGFPESHAASFALLVYLSAWQKIHFPAHFCCALINSQPMGFYSPSSLVRDAQQHGVEVRPVRVQSSHWDCVLESPTKSRINSRYASAHRALRLGLRLVKGLHRQAAERIVSARSQALFEDLADFQRRTQLHREQVHALAEAGALEDLVEGRRHALWAARAPHTGGLFAEYPIRERAINLVPLQQSEQLLLDYDRVGLSVDDHPVSHLRARLKPRGVLTARQLNDVAHQGSVRVAGLVLSRQRPGTASGVVFVTLEDETGIINLVLFSHVFERYRQQARHATLLLVEGRLERQLTRPRVGEVGRPTPVIHIIAKHLERLDDRTFSSNGALSDDSATTLRHSSRDFH